MKLGGRHKADPAFNMSSMTDVIFLLLIFFIMTSSNVTPTGKQVNLPKSGKAEAVKMQRVSVTISAEKDLFVNEEPVTRETLVAILDAKLSPKSEDKYKNVVMVRGDVSVPYGDVMEVVSLCSRIENATISLQLDPNKK